MDLADADALDRIYAREQALAADLAQALQRKSAFDALVAELELAALELGKEAVVNALPFLQVALRAAILAA